MNKALFFLFICLAFSLHHVCRGQDTTMVLSEHSTLPAEQEEDNNTLAKLMRGIEINFSALKDLLGFSEYKEKHWKVILESAQNIREKTVLMSQDFSRPSDWVYQELLENIQVVSNKIVSITKKYNIDLLTMASHGRKGISHMLMGSLAEKVVQMAPCPVLTIKHPEHEFVLP